MNQAALKKLCLLLAGAAALAMAWCFALPSSIIVNSSALRATIAAAALFLLTAALFFTQMQRRRERQTLAELAGYLSQIRPDARSGLSPSLSATLVESQSWFEACEKIKECVEAHLDDLREAEHLRASADMRVGRLTNQVQQQQEVVNGLPDPILAIDRYDELLIANPAAQRLFRLDTRSQHDGPIQQLIECETLVELLTKTRRRKTNSQRTVEITLIDHQDTARRYRVTCAGLMLKREGQEDQTSGAVAVLHDISNEAAIHKRNAEFVSAASHEMKTPLASIKAYVELLADGEAEDESTRDEFLDVVNTQADRLQRLVDNLLNLARIEAGVVKVSKHRRSLNELLDEAYAVVQPRAEKKQIKLIRDLSPMYLSVLVDRDMMLQAAINLLSNAIKYTPSGGRVILRSRQQDGEVLLEVEDTGVGLSADDCSKVFERFYRVKKESRSVAGTGLGLPLAKHIVEDVHGGRLTVTSVPEQGSLFRIALPQHAARATERRTEPVDAGEAEKTPGESIPIESPPIVRLARAGTGDQTQAKTKAKTDARTKAKTPRTAPEANYKTRAATKAPDKKLRVLICEDELPILRVAQMKLESANFDVARAEDGEEGWEQILTRTPDILITDCQMPRLDGIGLIQRVRQYEATHKLPVIFLTAKGFELGKELTEELNILAVINKPFSPRELLKFVEQVRKSSTFVARPIETAEATT